MAEVNEDVQRNKWLAGLKGGGSMFKDPALVADRTIVAKPASLIAKEKGEMNTKHAPVMDTWFSRRN